MKRRTTPTIQISHDLDMAAVSKVEFLFKQHFSETAEALLLKTYGDGGEVTESGGVFSIGLTADETALFEENEKFYIDPRVTMIDGSIPNTRVLSIQATATLWGEEDVGT